MWRACGPGLMLVFASVAIAQLAFEDFLKLPDLRRPDPILERPEPRVSCDPPSGEGWLKVSIRFDPQGKAAVEFAQEAPPAPNWLGCPASWPSIACGPPTAGVAVGSGAQGLTIAICAPVLE